MVKSKPLTELTLSIYSSMTCQALGSDYFLLINMLKDKK